MHPVVLMMVFLQPALSSASFLALRGITSIVISSGGWRMGGGGCFRSVTNEGLVLTFPELVLHGYTLIYNSYQVVVVLVMVWLARV